MKNKKRILSLVLAVLMIFAVACNLSACFGGNDTNTNTNTGSTNTDTGNTNTNTGSTNTNTNTNTGSGATTSYVIVVKSKGGTPLEGVKVYVADKDGNIKKEGIGTTGRDGTVTLSMPQMDGYTISLEDVPDGYIVEESYEMGTTGKEIVLTSTVIDGSEAGGASYQLGDIMHDYAITVDGTRYTFAEILEEKDAIVLNFWFTTCSYCIEEFPDMEASYAKYKDKIALFAINNHTDDNDNDVVNFKKTFHYVFGDFANLRSALKDDESPVKALGIAISYEVLSETRIGEGFDSLLADINASSDKNAAADAMADYIELVLANEDDSRVKTALEGFAKALKDVDTADEAALNKVFDDAEKSLIDSFSLDLPMAKDANHLENKFPISGNPVTIVIDRYGMISFMHTGAIPNEKYFDALFNYYTVVDYEQSIFSDISQLTPTVKPNVEMPSQEELAGVLNNGTIDVTYEAETESSDAEYAWPFVITTKDGVSCIKPSNFDQDTSFAALHAKVSLKKDEAFVFDYFSSSELGYDILYVLVDGKDIYTISGESDSWKGCSPYVALEDGVYDVTFVYNKNYSDYEGDDAVYLKNFRVVNKEELNTLGIEAYIPRSAATDLNEYGSDFENYVEVVLGEDGYYHVGTADGPILLANLIGYTNFSDETTVTLHISNEGKFMIDGVDYYNDFIKYCNYASNSQIYSYCSVTPKLREYLEAYVDQLVGVGETNKDGNQWLTLCYYYDAYGTNGKQFEDPIKGLAPFNAYVVNYDKDESVANVVEYNRVIMPRGLLYKFTPTESGVYRFTTNSVYEVDGWIFVGTHEEWVANGDRILYTYSDVGERFCPELLKDLDGDGTLERDYTNSSMVAYMEAGKDYYINFAYYDQYQYGTFTFDVKYIGETFGHFISASPGLFTTEDDEMQGDIIAGGIDVVLGEDGNYYHKLADGSQGSLVYADFHQYTGIFTTQSIKDILKVGGFNFAITDVDQEAIAYLNKYGEAGLRTLWGDSFQDNWDYYQMDDIIDEKYHGYVVDGVYKAYGVTYVTDEITGETSMVKPEIPKNATPAPDYSSVIEKYVELMLDEEDYPERQGCVVVTEELAQVLQMLLDKFTFPGIDHSWTKVCYYYEYLGTETAE